MSHKENAKKLLEKINDLNSLEQDPRITKAELSHLNFIDKVDWDLLKAMRVGVHHKQEFNCIGVPIYLRLLCSQEEEEIINTLMLKNLIPNTNGIWEMNHIKLVLSKASTIHPSLQFENNPTLSLETLNNMPMFLIEALGEAYIDFVQSCNINLDQLNETELKEIIDMLEKKPLLWKDLPYQRKEQVTIYSIKQCKILKQLRDNLITQS